MRKKGREKKKGIPIWLRAVISDLSSEHIAK
jgi:hypothetical protein